MLTSEDKNKIDAYKDQFMKDVKKLQAKYKRQMTVLRKSIEKRRIDSLQTELSTAQ